MAPFLKGHECVMTPFLKGLGYVMVPFLIKETEVCVLLTFLKI